MTDRPTRITSAALRLTDGRVVTLPPPARHHDIIAHVLRSPEYGPDDHLTAEQGFATDTLPFVRRPPALRIAAKAGQLTKDPIAPMHGLFSEDVW